MSPEELIYYRERAAFERQCAAASTNKHAAEIHRKLANLYDRLIALDQPYQPTLGLVEVTNPPQ